MNAETNIIELIGVSQDIAWLSWGVQYFFLIGLSIAAFLLTLPAHVFGRAGQLKTARIALIIAVTCGIAAPVALVADLHQPGRFYQFYLHFTPGSWMSWGSFFLPAYVVLLLLYAWSVFRPALASQAASGSGLLARVSGLLAMGGQASTTLVRRLGLLTLFAGLLVLLYTGAEMAVVKARLLWHTPMMPLLFVTTAMAGAAGLGLLLNRFLSDDDSAVRQQLNRTLGLFLLLSLLLHAIWLVSGTTSGQLLQRLAVEYNPVSFGLLLVLACSVLPLLIVWLLPQLTWLAGALALAGAWIFRWIMFIDGQSIPKNGAGFYEYALPMGSEGLLGILGTLGLWVLLMLLVDAILPWRGTASRAGQ